MDGGEEGDVHTEALTEPTSPPPAEADRRHAGPTVNGRRSAVSACFVLLGIVVIVSAAHVGVRDAVVSRAAMLAGTCLILWLSELVPLYATTLLLWAGIVLLLGPLE